MNQPISKEILLARKICCGCRCINCPYTPKWVKGSQNVKKNTSH